VRSWRVTGEATSDSFVLGRNEAKSIILILESLKCRNNELAGPAPQFRRAHLYRSRGDGHTNLGGHGSDTIVRAKEALAKDTVLWARSARSSSTAFIRQPEREILQEAAAREPENFDVSHKLEGCPG